MNENEFWSLIESAKAESGGGSRQQVERLRQKLEERSEQEILDFDRLLHEQMGKSYSWDLWAAAYIINGGCSDDGFDYFRAWMIAQGKDIFLNALKDPESLTEVAEADSMLEELLYVAAKSYERKIKSKFPHSFRPKIELTGEKWEEDEEALQAKYPKLFSRFWESRPAESLAPVAALLRDLIAREKTDVPGPEALFRQALIGALDESPENLAKSAALLTRAADQGHSGAQHLLGIYLQHGRGVPQSFPEAAKRYRQAAENGHAAACGAIALLYHQGLEIDQDYDEALKGYKKGAELGSPESEFGMGVLYSGGLGVEKNLQESFKWFHRAAQNGHAQAALNVGLYFLNGKGVERDPAEAFKWFSHAADAGSARARFNLGVLYENGRGVARDIPKAVEMYERAAAEGYDAAIVNLGMLYFNGKGVTQDFPKAAEFYRRAVDAGNLTALSNLAVLYQHGRGVPQDLAEAIRLFRRSAEAGIAVGQFNLGTMYHRGIGVSKDDQEALRWYRLAAAQNHGSAMNNIADAYETGTGVTQDYAEAAKWYRQAADRGVSASWYSLGKFYRDGLGVEKDYLEAEKCLKAAVDMGFEKAKPVLEALYADGHVERTQPAVSQVPSQLVVAATPQIESGPKIASAQSAARRALCLRSLICRLEIEVMLTARRQNPNAREMRASEILENDARKINEWLKDEELWMAASDLEKKRLKASPGAWSENVLKTISWRAEALGVIGWALGLTDRILPYDTLVLDSSFDNKLNILSTTKQFVADAKLRDVKEILQAREIAENWLWRARTTQIQKEPEKYPPPAGWTYEKIIEMAAEHWEKEGLFTRIAGDYPVRGKAYRDLIESEWQELRSLATERLYGLNWLCGYSANWDSVPTGT